MFNTSKLISLSLTLSLSVLLLAGCETFGPSTNGQRIGFVEAMDLSLREGDLSHTDELLPSDGYNHWFLVMEVTRMSPKQFKRYVRRTLISIRRSAIEQGFKWEESELTGTYIGKVNLAGGGTPEEVKKWWLLYFERNGKVPFEELLPFLDELSDEDKAHGSVFLRFEDPERIAVVRGLTTVLSQRRIIDPMLFDWHLYEVSDRGQRFKDDWMFQPWDQGTLP